MKKVSKWGGAIFGVLALLCCGGVFVLPNEWHVKTSVVIDAPADQIYPIVARPRQWVAVIERAVQKMPDGEKANFTYTFSDVSEGVGAWWVSESSGMGYDSRVRVEYTRAEPGVGLWYDGMIQQDEVNDHGSMTFEAVEGGTRVTWEDRGTIAASKGGGLTAMAVGPSLEPAFQAYLLELKDVVESGVQVQDVE